MDRERSDERKESVRSWYIVYPLPDDGLVVRFLPGTRRADGGDAMIRKRSDEHRDDIRFVVAILFILGIGGVVGAGLLGNFASPIVGAPLAAIIVGVLGIGGFFLGLGSLLVERDGEEERRE